MLTRSPQTGENTRLHTSLTGPSAEKQVTRSHSANLVRGAQLDSFSTLVIFIRAFLGPLVYRFAVVAFAIQGALHFALVDARPPDVPPFSEGILLIASIGSLVGVPFAYCLSAAKADGMAKHWRVPKRTFILSRPLARFIFSGVFGIAIGGIVVAPFVELTLLPMIAGHALLAVAMTVGMRRRFASYPCTEWAMPPPGYQLLMPIIRGTRPDA